MSVKVDPTKLSLDEVVVVAAAAAKALLVLLLLGPTTRRVCGIRKDWTPTQAVKATTKVRMAFMSFELCCSVCGVGGVEGCEIRTLLGDVIIILLRIEQPTAHAFIFLFLLEYEGEDKRGIV